jgi:uncharacterized protein YfaS (alpha-2-macroglobulin family)
LTAPEVTRMEEKLKPHPALLEFDGSAAPLRNVEKIITAGIEISPKLDGIWKWESDRELSFTPKADWPVGQAYTVKLAKEGLVAPHVKLSTYKLEFQSAPFTIKLAEHEFYQDPVDADLKKVVATFTFSHPVDPAQFEKRVKLRLEPQSKEDPSRDYQFHVSYDRWKVNAYVHSEPVSVPQKDATMHITLESGIHAARGGPAFEEKIADDVKVPGLYNFLKVSSARLTIVDNERYEPEQVLVIETSAGVAEAEMQKNLTAWLLPVYDPDNAEELKYKRAHAWANPEMVDAAMLKKATRLPLQQVANEKEFSTLHSFKVKAEAGRWIYIQVKKGLRAFGGYVLGETFDGTQRVGEYPRQLRILSSGALLSLSGEKKVSVYARDVPAVRFQLGRILPDQLHHLFTQAGGPFQAPSFGYRFDEENLAEFFVEDHELPRTAPGKPQYEALDLSKYLDGRGVFLLHVQSWDPVNKIGLGEQDSRLLLVSDLGVLVKDAADGTHDVFVQSIHTGEPVGGARVQVIGKNGQAVLTTTTDHEGHAQLASLADFKREKTPLAYVVSKGRDSSFLPMNRGDRVLNTSRFDVGGVTDDAGAKGLSAYVFSDRGLYRPGDEMRFGIVVRSREFKKDLKGVPLQVTITDARGLTVRKENLKLGATAFEELRHTTPEVAPTGTYSVNVYVVKDGRPANLLGSTTVKVREFQPDRMKISVRLSAENPEGWVSPKDLKGRIALTNLFGTPAAKRKVRAQIKLAPALPKFAKLRDFHFFDPLKARDSFADTLSDVETDDQGTAELDLGLQRFAAATYRLSLLGEGFEADGGRSVAAEASVMVSPLAYLIGYKADGDLRYLPRSSEHAVELVAVGPRGDRVEVKGLKSVLLERKFVSVLTRQDNGTYKYESVRKELEVSQKPLELAQKGGKAALPTGKAGDFALVLRNAKDEELQRIEYSVAGQGNLGRDLDKSAELQIALKKTDVDPGESIELSIKAPFTGSGLITIEREKVFAHKWFNTTTTATVQSIQLPADFEGDGYVSVAFIRDPSSDEVFLSPLSYGVVPFSVSRQKRVAEISVASPELTKPGEPYRMRVSADRPTKMVVFAVDEGILRVARYDTPDPLGFFFKKRALGVRTSQILDLILPDFGKLMSALAPGGDDDAAIGANLNPFKRKQNKPVAWWSGIIDVGEKGREVVYDVPDYFNGTLHVMAVAVAGDSIGTFEKKAIVRGDFVISPNVPMVAAPGDEFEVSVSVANNVVGSGAKAGVTLELKTSKHLEIVGSSQAKLTIDELREGTATFKLKATSQLGSGSLTFTASLGGKTGKLTTDLSVRPSTPYLSTFAAGHLKDGAQTVPVPRQLYGEYRTLKAGISHLPLGLTHGLMSYLEKYPHGCTEQVSSQLVPAVVLGKRPEFGFNAESSAKAVTTAIATLRTRQNEEGAFGMWAANPHVMPLASVYALHVLTEAKERGHAVPSEMMKSGVAWLQSLARADADDLPGERVRAYAIYVLTRNGMVTSGFATALQKRLEANYPKQWKKDLAGAYLASTYALLKQERLGRGIIEEQKLGVSHVADYGYYYDSLAHDAQLLYLLARHFPDRAARVTPAELNAMVEPIFKGSYNTFSSAQTILALEAYGEAAAQNPDGALGIREVVGGQKSALTLPAGLLPLVDFSDKASAIEFSTSGAFGGYWLVNQRGFDLKAPEKAIASKVEVFREYTDVHGKVIDQVVLGEEVQVHVKVRALGKQTISDLAIVDLLPGGFEVVMQDPPKREQAMEEGGGEEHASDEGGEGDEAQGQEENQRGEGDDVPEEPSHGDEGGGAFALPIALEGATFLLDYGDVREDRVVLYGSAGEDVKELVYVIKATNVGTYSVPPVLADAMYDRSIVARGLGGKIKVVAR